MGIGVGILLLVIGLILVLGVIDGSRRPSQDVVDAETLGWICLVVGALAIVLALVMNQQRSKTTHVEERRTRAESSAGSARGRAAYLVGEPGEHGRVEPPPLPVQVYVDVLARAEQHQPPRLEVGVAAAARAACAHPRPSRTASWKSAEVGTRCARRLASTPRSRSTSCWRSSFSLNTTTGIRSQSWPAAAPPPFGERRGGRGPVAEHAEVLDRAALHRRRASEVTAASASPLRSRSAENAWSSTWRRSGDVVPAGDLGHDVAEPGGEGVGVDGDREVGARRPVGRRARRAPRRSSSWVWRASAQQGSAPPRSAGRASCAARRPGRRSTRAPGSAG